MTDEVELVKKTLLLPKRDIERFKARHKGHGDFTAFVREALRRYNDLNDTNPDELINLAVAEIKLDSRSQEP